MLIRNSYQHNLQKVLNNSEKSKVNASARLCCNLVENIFTMFKLNRRNSITKNKGLFRRENIRDSLPWKTNLDSAAKADLKTAVPPKESLKETPTPKMSHSVRLRCRSSVRMSNSTVASVFQVNDFF